MWEIRIAVGVDAVTGRTRQRSRTVHGTEHDAEQVRVSMVAEQVSVPSLPAGSLITVGELLQAWVIADHGWKPSTLVGYRSVVRALEADPLGRVRVAALTPNHLRRHMARWQGEGAGLAVVGGRFRALRSAVGWGWDERILASHPLRGMRGPGRPDPRRPLTDEEVRTLLGAAEMRLLEAVANDNGTAPAITRRHRAEQDLLLVRLAADTGARRGELAALRVDDLVDRVLRIDRAVSAGQLTTPKSGRGRVLTVGDSTAALWHGLVRDWSCRAEKPLGPWLLSSDTAHEHRLGAEVLGHRFQQRREAAGIHDATLHRLRHSVATFLVGRGEILQAQSRLGHADAAITLREYAYALPLSDGSVADAINNHLDRPAETRPASLPAEDPT